MGMPKEKWDARSLKIQGLPRSDTMGDVMPVLTSGVLRAILSANWGTLPTEELRGPIISAVQEGWVYE